MSAPLVGAQELARWAAETPRLTSCECGLAQHRAWTSLHDGWQPKTLEPIATLRDRVIDEPTFAEYRPGGVHYESPDFPVAPLYFPYNRSEVLRCTACGRHALRYTEYGGYYMDHRLRCLTGLTVVDQPLPTAAA